MAINIASSFSTTLDLVSSLNTTLDLASSFSTTLDLVSSLDNSALTFSFLLLENGSAMLTEDLDGIILG